MANLIADIFVTIKPIYDRLPLTIKSLSSLDKNTDRSQYRLTLCLDGNSLDAGLTDCIEDLQPDYILKSYRNEGLGPTINRAVAHIKSVNDWYADIQAGDANQVAPYICMCQDDLLYTQNWLPVLASRFRSYGTLHKLGFASGVECIEHPVKENLSDGIVLKDWIRASQMLSTREYWESLTPIPRFDPETGQMRAKPNNGMGSGVDWWLVRNHENSVCKTGRTNLVMPGLVQHAGYADSTWLQNGREMPESDLDKELIKKCVD